MKHGLMWLILYLAFAAVMMIAEQSFNFEAAISSALPHVGQGFLNVFGESR